MCNGKELKRKGEEGAGMGNVAAILSWLGKPSLLKWRLSKDLQEVWDSAMWFHEGSASQAEGTVSITSSSQEHSWNVRETESRHMAGEVLGEKNRRRNKRSCWYQVTEGLVEHCKDFVFYPEWMGVLSESFEHRGDSILKVPSAVLWVDFRGTWKKQGENYCHHPGRNHGSFARVEAVKLGRRCHILDTFQRKSWENFLTERMWSVRGKRGQRWLQAISLSS